MHNITKKMKVVKKKDWPEGLVLYEGCFDGDTSLEIFEYLERLVEASDGGELKRGTIHYSYKYPYAIKEPAVATLDKAEDPPTFIRRVGEIMFESGMMKVSPNQQILNDYPPGVGIGKHRDHYPIFDDSIASVSFGSGVVMTLRKYHDANDTPIDIYLPVGSILVIEGEARMNYSHEIAGRQNDVIEGEKVKRSRRISITYRRVRDEYLPKSPPRFGVKVLPVGVPSRSYEVYTDGACVPNPGKGGWGVVVYTRGKEICTFHGGSRFTTNNKMELIGVIRGLKWVERLKGKVDVVLYSDSQYCLGGIVKNVHNNDNIVEKGIDGWIVGWKRGGWKRGKNNTEDIKNVELWQEIESIIEHIIEKFSLSNSSLIIKWVKGHSGNLGNDRADELSNLGIP